MKRLISLILSLVMISSLLPSAFAASDEAAEAAQALYELGLFNGTGTNPDGTPDFDLERAPTRAEAVTMLVRLLGKEEESKAGTWETPFTDVADWAMPYVGYAYTNGLTAGTSETTFGCNEPVTAAQYLTFILRALGYESGTDFQWNRAWEKSDELGLTDGHYNAGTTNFTRGDVAVISNNALSVTLRGQTKSLSEVLGITQHQVTIEDLQGIWRLTYKDKIYYEVIIEGNIATYMDTITGAAIWTGPFTITDEGKLKWTTCQVYIYDPINPLSYYSLASAKGKNNDIVYQERKSESMLNPKNVEDLLNNYQKVDESALYKSCSDLIAKYNEVDIWKTEGNYRVGTDIPAGDYCALQTAGNNGYYCIYNNTSKNDIIDNDIFYNQAFFRVADGQYLNISRCKIALASDATLSIQPDADGFYGPGEYRVGIDIPAGEYQFAATNQNNTGYYCTYSDITKENIDDNEIFKANAYYTVHTGQILSISRAKAILISKTNTQTASSTTSIPSGIRYYSGTTIPTFPSIISCYGTRTPGEVSRKYGVVDVDQYEYSSARSSEVDLYKETLQTVFGFTPHETQKNFYFAPNGDMILITFVNTTPTYLLITVDTPPRG